MAIVGRDFLLNSNILLIKSVVHLVSILDSPFTISNNPNSMMKFNALPTISHHVAVQRAARQILMMPHTFIKSIIKQAYCEHHINNWHHPTIIHMKFIVASLLFLIVPVLVNAQNMEQHQAAIDKIQLSEGTFGYEMYYPGEGGQLLLGASIDPQSTDTLKLMRCYHGMGHRYVNMDLATSGITYHLTFGYDQFRDIYILSALDSGPALVDVYQGDIDSNGDLILDNLASGTHYVDGQGVKHHNRLSLLDMASSSFTFLIEHSVDQGESWEVQAKYIFAATGI